MTYATFDDVLTLGFEVGDGEDEEGKFERLLLPAASRLIDRACEAPDGFFDKAGNSATAKTFYGDGSDYLSLPPFVADSISSVALPNGYAALSSGDYYESSDSLRGFFLVRQYSTTRLSLTDPAAWAANGLLPSFPIGPFDLVTNNFRSLSNRGAGWPRGVAVTVTAKWGRAEVPSEVIAATVEIALKLFRTVDEAEAKVSDLEQRAAPTALGPAATLVADKYRVQRFSAFS